VNRSAKIGSHQPSATKLAATTAPFSISAFPSSSPISALARGDGHSARLLRALGGVQLHIVHDGDEPETIITIPLFLFAAAQSPHRSMKSGQVQRNDFSVLGS
jgi:hypothetical protein